MEAGESAFPATLPWQALTTSPTAQYAVPSLTTVSFDKRQVASEALRLLTERMADRTAEQRVVAVDYSIVERDSTRG